MLNKKGVSLIVLVITVVVMVIIASAIIITLENTGVIGRSKSAVNKQQYKEEYTRLETLKNGILTDNIGKITVEEYTAELLAAGIIESDVTTNIDGSKTAMTKSGYPVAIIQDGEHNLIISLGEKNSSLNLDLTSIEADATYQNITRTLNLTTNNVFGNVSWVSSDPSIATVVGTNDRATVTILKKGEATITAVYGSAKATCNVNSIEKVELGSLVTPSDYGKPISYTVNVDGYDYSNWKIYYEDETLGYVYIISDSVKTEAIGKLENSKYTGLGDVSELTEDDLRLYNKFRLNQDNYTLNAENANSNAVAYLIKNYANYGKTTAPYKTYVEGAIGGPTLELLCAGWNAWNEAKKLTNASHTYKAISPTPVADSYGYKINNSTYVVGLVQDGFYLLDGYYWLATPGQISIGAGFSAGEDYVGYDYIKDAYLIRPVVCLRSDVPARLNADGTGYEL